MDRESATLEEVLALARLLAPRDKVRLIELLAPSTGADLKDKQPVPRKDLYGLFRHLGPAPSAEDIDEARREEWSGFPREDI